MGKFNFENLDIKTVSNETIAELSNLLWEFTSTPGKEEVAIYEEYESDVNALVDSLNPKQKKWFDRYQQMADDALILAQRKMFICGFKTAMRLAFESLK